MRGVAPIISIGHLDPDVTLFLVAQKTVKPRDSNYGCVRKIVPSIG